MGIFNNLKSKIQDSQGIVKGILKNYILFNSETKELTLTEKVISLFCNRAVSKVEGLKSLKPDFSEGLIATVEHKEVQVKIHFNPEKITLNKDSIEGEIKLLTPPQFETNSMVYRYLIAGWKIFLGGKIPNLVLPEKIRIEKDRVYYILPRSELKLLNALFSSLENGSTVKTSVMQSNLIIKTSVALNWNNLNLQNLLQLLNLK